MRIFWSTLGFIAAAAAVLYVFDYISARYAIPGNRQVYADVTVTQYWAVKEKGNKIEYSPADPVVERCVYAVFPHFGYKPCWYLMRHTRRAIEVGEVGPGSERNAGAGAVGFSAAGVSRREIAHMDVTRPRCRIQPSLRR